MYWTESSVDYVTLYEYDKNGNLAAKQELADSVQTATWSYDWDREDRMTRARKWTGPTSSETLVLDMEYKYCPSCDGALSERIEKDGAGTIQSWLRYEYEGLNLLRIDQRYDSDSDGNAVIDDNDPWRPINVYAHGPGDLGSMVRNQAWGYSGGSSWSFDIYPIYDALGNVIGTYNPGGVSLFQMDAFGNNTGSAWPSMESSGPKEHLTGKMYDEEVGFYYFHARWYDPVVGRFVGRARITPSQEHPYLFANGSPVRFCDPYGNAPWPNPPTFSSCVKWYVDELFDLKWDFLMGLVSKTEYSIKLAWLVGQLHLCIEEARRLASPSPTPTQTPCPPFPPIPIPAPVPMSCF